ncbi:hypothetical protein MTO96_021565 [Rhipicephalus appendiculatus]
MVRSKRHMCIATPRERTVRKCGRVFREPVDYRIETPLSRFSSRNDRVSTPNRLCTNIWITTFTSSATYEHTSGYLSGFVCDPSWRLVFFRVCDTRELPPSRR